MQIRCTQEESAILERIAKAASQLSIKAWLIGGFVRDKIMERPTHEVDMDIVCLGDGIELARATAALFSPVPHVNFFKTFGTAQINIEQGNESFDIEFVGARKESYRSNSRKPEVEAGTLEDDQQRRDFTINALGISLNEENYGELLDPFGGLNDIENKIIRTPMEPDRTFSDDPLRMMRGIRFATQLNFTIEAATYRGIKENVHRISIVSKERIADELTKIVASPKPSIGFDLLFKSGLLK